MKKIFIMMMALFLSLAAVTTTQAQVKVQVNIGSQPGWGPTGYNYVPYYYFPDYNFYYDVNLGEYIILVNNTWTYVTAVPARFHFNPYNAYKVVINRTGKPYLNNKVHIREYAKFKGQGPKQAMIRDSREEKYFESRQHPNHDQWTKSHSDQGGRGAARGGSNGNGRRGR